MGFQDWLRLKAARYGIGSVIAAGAIAATVRFFDLGGASGVAAAASLETAPVAQANPGAPPVAPSLDLTETQLRSFKIGAVGTYVFPIQADAVGSIDFNEDMDTQVFSNYNGHIVSLYAKVGDDVGKDEPLFTIDSPDLVQAESTLISAAGVLWLTTRALDRAKELANVRGYREKTTTRRCPTSKPPRTTTGPPSMRCASSARPRRRSNRWRQRARSIRSW
jgi:cobalt-zinc-cadmium efflux system membrane fusion protein